MLAVRFIDAPEMLVAGLSGEYTSEKIIEIPKQWGRFSDELQVTDLQYDATYGVVFPTTVMRYLTCLEVASGTATPSAWETYTLPAQRYAVFKGTGGLDALRQAWPAIWKEWLPASGAQLVPGAAMLERYTESWMRSGDFQIWLPVQP